MHQINPAASRCCLTLAVVAAEVLFGQALAQEKNIDELTVTARKREENIQSVPVSITAFSSTDLEIRDIVNLERLADQTPGLSFGTAGSLVNRRAVIRGVAQQTRVGDEPNVATFIDGVYTPGFSGAEFFGFDSIARIEVLKGPQSALYGRNSFAGAINYVTAKPGDEFLYGGQVIAGQSDRAGASGYVSLPLIEDTLSVRLDGGYNRSGGTNENSLNGDALGSTDTVFTRLGIRWDITDRLTTGLSLSWQDDETNAAPVTIVADDDPNRIGTKMIFTFSPFEFAAGGGGPIGRLYNGAIKNTSDPYFIDTRSYAGERTISRLAFNFEYDFGGVQLVGLTGYQERKVDTLGDFNTCRPDVRAAVCDTVSPTAIGTFFGGPLANSPLVGSVLTGSLEDRNEFSQDLRLQSADDGMFNWAVGVYFSTEEFTDETQRLSDLGLTNGDGTIIYAVQSPVPLIDQSTELKNRFYSGYGSLGVDLGTAWSVSVEGRVTREEKFADQVANNFPTNVPPTGFQKETFRFFTPRLIVDYMATDDLLIYASAAKGVKSGGFNPGSVTFPVYKEETNWTYELGSKYTFLDGKARINGAVYFIDWDDQQITSTDPDNTRLPITINVAKTEIKGAELEAFFNPTDWLQINLGAAYIDAEYKEGVSVGVEDLTDCENLSIPCDKPGVGGMLVTSGDISGQKVVGTPKSSFNAGIQGNWPIASGSWELLTRLDYSWQDRIFIDEANAGYIPERNTVNLRLGVNNKSWRVEGFCNNLTDDDTPLFALPPRDILGVPHFAVVNRDQRLCGLQVAYRSQ